LHLNAKAYKGNKQRGIELLKGILNDDVEDEELAEKKQESAFILGTLATEKGGELDFLFELCEQDDELALKIFQALNYANNPFICEWITNRFDSLSPDTQKGLVGILEYKNKLKTDDWYLSANNREPEVLERIYRAHVQTGYLNSAPDVKPLLQDPNADWFEEALFSALISGDEKALIAARKRMIEAPDKVQKLPIYFACTATRSDDLLIVKRCIPEEAIRTHVIKALGILGLPLAVPALIEMIDDHIKDKEHWDQQYLILESLDLITGASLPLLFPDIKEGPEDKRHEVKVETAWRSQWMSWWIENQYHFDSDFRYRRGVPFTIESCINEMMYEKGNYWCRQLSFHELQIRTGQCIVPFFADWDIKDQINAINHWHTWWGENKSKYPSSQWLYAGRDI
ncbi:MAG: HEAT repeat domain-containing protein, partial [Proteobacteria bacterium]|nr:HEAT repeat domain-containing protein [Pseudomonadota bacterium]